MPVYKRMYVYNFMQVLSMPPVALKGRRSIISDGCSPSRVNHYGEIITGNHRGEPIMGKPSR